MTCVLPLQDFYTQADSMKAAKLYAPVSASEAAAPSSLASAVRSGKRAIIIVGGLSLALLAAYVLWPRGSLSGFGYGYDGVEETEHFVTVSGTQVHRRPVQAPPWPLPCSVRRRPAATLLQLVM